MLASSANAVGFTGGVLAVGLSATIQLPAISFQSRTALQYIAGQTIFIAGSSASVFGNGRLWGITTVPSIVFEDFAGPLYFTAGGITALISWHKTLTDPTF